MIAGAVAIALAAGVLWNAQQGTTEGSSDTELDITLEFFDGSSQQLSVLEGKPVVLNFWASWCPACVSEMPAFGDVHRELGAEVEFIGINMQEVDLDAAMALVEQTNLDYRLAYDPDGAIFNQFGGIAMPTTVFISADGSVAMVHAGTISENDLTEKIESELLG